MNRKRLRILAQFLSNLDRKHFNLETWCEIDGGKVKDGRIKEVGCETTACAMGWAASIPSFHRDGLKLKMRVVKDCLGEVDRWLEPALGRLRGFEAAMDFFDISYADACGLFCPDYYPENQRKNPKHVVKRIERLLDGKEIQLPPSADHY